MYDLSTLFLGRPVVVVTTGVACGESLLVGSFGRCFDVSGAVGASASK